MAWNNRQKFWFQEVCYCHCELILWELVWPHAQLCDYCPDHDNNYRHSLNHLQVHQNLLYVLIYNAIRFSTNNALNVSQLTVSGHQHRPVLKIDVIIINTWKGIIGICSYNMGNFEGRRRIVLSIPLQCIVFFPSPWQVYAHTVSSYGRGGLSGLGMSAGKGGGSRSP